MMVDANEIECSNQMDDACNNVRGDNRQFPTKSTPFNSRKRSDVWDHFTEVKNENPNVRRKATCNYCGACYACDPKINGTTSMKTHIQKQCKKNPLRNLDKPQPILAIKPKADVDDNGTFVADRDNRDTFVDNCRQALAEMLIRDELPFKHVEGEGFKMFMSIVCPNWNEIPSSVTVAKDCLQVYLREKKALKTALIGQRVCLTLDRWTSLQNLNYICLTAHFVDSDWTLHKRILNFCTVESHKDEILTKQVELCLHEWGIENILSLTVDNASSNNLLIDALKRKTKDRKETILEHEFLHMRCCVHILNLIVRDALKDMDESITKVRNAVRYVKSSPQRWEAFKICSDMEKIDNKDHVCLDVSNRWNYTYSMLERAENFQRAFERLEEDDKAFCLCVAEGKLGDGDDESTIGGRETSLGPPNSEDWEKIRLLIKFLKLFYDAVLQFSSSNQVTCNSFFMELITIKTMIDLEGKQGPDAVGLIATKMKAKLDEYWGKFENMNTLLFVAIVLDPRYKLGFVEFCFENVYGAEKAFDLTRKVKETLTRLYDLYAQNERGIIMQEENEGQLVDGLNKSIDPTDFRALIMSEFRQHLKKTNLLDSKSDVEKYLMEDCEDDVEGFDLLGWWKHNTSRYRILSLVARHVLAMPISTVGSESAFSTGDRVLDPFRSALSPHMVEALICAQNWLRSSPSPIGYRDGIGDVEEYEKLESEFIGEASSSDP